MDEILLVIFVGAILLVGPIATLVLAIIAYVRSRQVGQLAERIARLEQRLNQRTSEAGAEPRRDVAPATLTATTADSVRADVPATVAVVESDVASAEPVIAAMAGSESAAVASLDAIPTASLAPSRDEASSTEPVGWETFIGQKAFGWVAVVLFIFAAAFFLRYAYQNEWIGPIGRVAIGEIVGVALLIGGLRYLERGWRRFSNMLTAAGSVVLYLATFSAFGFYDLLPQQHAGIFLSLVVAGTMLLAVLYRSATVALMAVIGGLLTPVLLGSDHDAYSALFLYLAVLNLAVVAALVVRSWLVVGTVAYLGTQGLYWAWYSQNYHPEKFDWAFGFQSVIFLIYLALPVVAKRLSGDERRDSANDRGIKIDFCATEHLARFVVNAILGFVGLRALLRPDYEMWMGCLALGLATLYAAVARGTLTRSKDRGQLLLTSLAISIGFIAWAFPLQANARWVACGWAAMGAALWWFGLRIASIPLRVFAGVLAAMSVARVILVDCPTSMRDPFTPIFNSFALPSLVVAALILISVLVADRYLTKLQLAERFLIGGAGVSGTMLVLLVLSLDVYGYFESQSLLSPTADLTVLLWRGQLALTVLWTSYATLLLVGGFRFGRARLRWLAMALFGVTVLKIFVVDMANVQQLYRILAFFGLAVVLGLVARAYQRFK